jgi:hypothetical protein
LLSKINIYIPDLAAIAPFTGAKRYISLMNLLGLNGGRKAIIVRSLLPIVDSENGAFSQFFAGKRAVLKRKSSSC